MPDNREPQLDELRRRARRRLIGAVVLALAAAVLVPMLLESDPKPLGEDVAVRIPPIDDGKFVSRLGEKGKAAEPAAAAPAKTEPKAEAKPDARPEAAAPATEPGKEAPKPAEAPKDAAAAKTLANAEQRVLAPPAKSAGANARPSTTTVASAPPKAAEASKPAEIAPKAGEADKGGSYSVQLAAFIDDKGANSLAGKLKKSGYPAYTEPYETSRGTLWRVRVGPYPSRDAAEGVRAKLKAEGQNGIIAAAK